MQWQGKSTNLSSTKYGELAIPTLHETAEIKFMNSSKITSALTALVK